MENLIKEATRREKSAFKGVYWKVVSSSVFINTALFSDILATVKDPSIALQNNSFNIVRGQLKSQNAYTKIYTKI